MPLLKFKAKIFPQSHKIAGKATLTSQINTCLNLPQINFMSTDIGGVR